MRAPWGGLRQGQGTTAQSAGCSGRAARPAARPKLTALAGVTLTQVHCADWINDTVSQLETQARACEGNPAGQMVGSLSAMMANIGSHHGPGCHDGSQYVQCRCPATAAAPTPAPALPALRSSNLRRIWRPWGH